MPRISRSILVIGVALLALIVAWSSPLFRPASTRPALSQWRPAGAAPTAAILATPLVPPEVVRILGTEPPAAPPRMLPGAMPSPMPLLALPTPLPLDSGAGRSIDAHLQNLANLNLFSGAVLVARGGTVIVSKGYGMTDRAQATPNTPQTRFRIASLTKQFTAMAILILQTRGALHVNDPICAYLDDCPPAWQPITIRHLLTHTSGLPNYTDSPSFANVEMLPATPGELIARFRDLPLVFAPGAAYAYGNSGYVLLGAIIERASGQSYGDFLRAAIFAPLLMNNSGYATGVNADGWLARGYAGGRLADAIDTSTLFAAGGLYSTVEDLYRWDQALATDQLIPPELRAEMFAPGVNGYGYGWKVGLHNGRLFVAHPGSMSGCSTYIARYPDTGVTVIILSNLENVAAGPIADYLADLVFLGG